MNIDFLYVLEATGGCGHWTTGRPTTVICCLCSPNILCRDSVCE